MASIDIGLLSFPNLSRLILSLLFVLPLVYLFQLNRLLSGTPDEVRRLSPSRWTRALLRETYRSLEEKPITTDGYVDRLPPKLERRYIVTGGSGLVGGYIVLQLLARGHPPEAIRILDFQRPRRPDLLAGAAARVGFMRVDVASAASTDAAFSAPWPSAVAALPLTVFHTAAVIVPSDRSAAGYGFCEAVNVRGTEHVVASARRAAADVLVSTTSGSIAIRPVGLWPAPWRLWSSWPRHFWQVLDDADFFAPLRPRRDFYANYPVSKAAAERIVCAANSPSFRTGCIRPANGVYGNPTDNTVGGSLSRGFLPSWTAHVVQSFAHGINVAAAHLQFEAVLAPLDAATAPQAGRPFTITDPNPSITYGDLYFLLATLAATPFRALRIPPLAVLLPSYLIEWYSLVQATSPLGVGRLLPPLAGDVKHLRPPLFSITTHLVASNEAASRPVADGGLGYRGIVTTLQGMALQVLEWNREHSRDVDHKKTYQTSVSLAEEIQKLGAVGERRLSL